MIQGQAQRALSREMIAYLAFKLSLASYFFKACTRLYVKFLNLEHKAIQCQTFFVLWFFKNNSKNDCFINYSRLMEGIGLKPAEIGRESGIKRVQDYQKDRSEYI